MDTRIRRNESNIYTKEQIKRVITGAGLTVENEVDSDFIVFCPFHNNNRTPAAEVHKSNGTFFCFSCQKVADLVELVMHTSGRKYFEAVRYIKSKEVESNLEQDVLQTLYIKPDFVQFDELMLKRLHNNLLESERAKNYYAYRKISPESWNRFLLGYSEKQDMVVVPVHTAEGMAVGFVGRSIEGKDFKNSPGLPKSKTLFNLHRVKTANKVYVVESSFDAIRLDQCGFPAVATLGANVSSAQLDLLQKYFNDILIIADNDEAGGNMKNRILERIGTRASVIQLNKQYKDIGDMDDTSIKELEYQFDKSIQSMLN
jgi:DNA primase